MHIVLTVNAAWNLTNFRAPLIRYLLDQGHRVTILAPQDPAFETLSDWGCDCVHLEMDVEGLSPRRDFALMRRMRRQFRALNPDVILSFTIKNNLFGAIAARPLRIPFVPTVTGLGTAFLSGRILQSLTETLYRVAFRRVPVVVFQNSDDSALFVARGLVKQQQVRLSPGSGIDTAAFQASPLPTTGPGPVFLMIGRLLSAKGAREYVEAARMVRQSHPDARFQLLGPSDAKNRHAIGADELQGWIDEGVVEYLGQTDDVRPMISAAHCVVLPSYREGTPRTLLEAACMGRPQVATDVPGCRQVVAVGETGLLCAVKSAASLAGALRDFADLGPDEWQRMGQASRARMEAVYDVSNVNTLYADILSNLHPV